MTTSTQRTAAMGVTPFGRRSCLYWELHRQCSSRTHFFAAAALTNSALHGLYSRVGRCIASAPAREFLAVLGAHLEPINVHSAQRIASGAYNPPNLDVAMIKREQEEVQLWLDARTLQDAPVHSEVLESIDRVLNWGGVPCDLGLPAALRAYLSILRGVRRQLRAPIRFVRQSHRESVGFALIRLLGRRPATQETATLPLLVNRKSGAV